jgi:hypothetical protein
MRGREYVKANAVASKTMGVVVGPSFEYGEIYFHWPTEDQIDAVRKTHSEDRCAKFAANESDCK